MHLYNTIEKRSNKWITHVLHLNLSSKLSAATHMSLGVDFTHLNQ